MTLYGRTVLSNLGRRKKQDESNAKSIRDGENIDSI